MPTSGWKQFAIEQQYDARYFARKYRLPIAIAREILRQAGNSRQRAIHLAMTRHETTAAAPPSFDPLAYIGK